MTQLLLFQDAAEEPGNVQIKTEPDGDVEIQSYPILKQLSVKLTDCRLWLDGRDFLSLGKKTHHQFIS